MHETNEGWTKGPWEFKAAAKATTLDRDALLDVAIVATVDGRKQVIAEAFGRVDVNSYPPALQNAMLMAAAPDLYEAIDDSLEYLRLTLGPCELDCTCIIHKLEAALAKATAVPVSPDP